MSQKTFRPKGLKEQFADESATPSSQGGDLGAGNSGATLAGACVGPAQPRSEQEPEITQLKLLMLCAVSLIGCQQLKAHEIVSLKGGGGDERAEGGLLSRTASLILHARGSLRWPVVRASINRKGLRRETWLKPAAKEKAYWQQVGCELAVYGVPH